MRPPLKTTGGPIEALIVSKDEAELGLVSFTAGMGAAGSETHAGWRAKLPAKPISITAALGPESSGSVRHVVFVARHGRPDFRSSHARYAAGLNRLSEFHSAMVAAGDQLADAAPSFLVEEDRRVRVAVLSRTGTENRAAEFVEVVFGANGEPVGAPAVTALGDLPETLVNGAALFVDSQGALVRREAVVEMGGDHLLKMKDGKLSPVSVAGRPTNPILLAPGKNVSYIIYFDPERGLSIQPL